MDDLSLLLLHIEWGADEALEDAPLDRLRPPQAAPTLLAPRPVPARPAPPLGTPLGTPPLGTPVERAARVADEALSLEALRAAIAGFDGCALRDMATHLVFAAGDPDAGTLLIGGAPGADEDRAGIPFAGAEGALLDQMLASVGLKRGAMLLTQAIPWRPPGGRVPTPNEIQLCRPFLLRLIALTLPRRIVLFGALAANIVLGAAPRARRIGWIEAPLEGGAAQALLLPALGDVLKNPARRKDSWAGMRALRRVLDG